jgi:hypothetical protein
LDEVDERFSLRHKPETTLPDGRIRPRLLTEGKTDVSHMSAAQRSFHASGDFLDFELTADGSSAKHGDKNLLRACEALAMTPQPRPCVCLFDRDNEDTLNKAVDGGEWKDWGNGVVAVALAGRGDERICIESLYDQESREIRNGEGRRLFLMDEFDQASGHHEKEAFNAPFPDRKKLIPDAVFAMDGGSLQSLTKAEFADAVEGGEGEFARVSFDGFRPTFEVIRRALQAAAQGVISAG